MTHPTDDSLKPCPFCGGAASLHPRTCDKNTPYNPADRAFPVARCGQCGAEALGKDWGKPETAAEKWNTRALLAEQARTEPDATPMNFARLKFFRDLNSAERIKVLRVFMDLDGIPDDQIDTHGVQTMLLKNVFATTQPLKAEDAPSEELPRFNEAQERADFEAHLKAELKSHWIYNNPNGRDLVDMMVSVVPDEINGHKQTNAGRYVDKGIETQWHGWRARAARAAERKA